MTTNNYSKNSQFTTHNSQLKLQVSTNRWWHIIIHISIIGLFLALVAWLFFSFFLPSKTLHGQSLAVPKLVGMTLEEAKKYLEERNLDFIVKDSIFSGKMPAHTILEQHPQAGTKVKAGRRIHLVITPKSTPPTKLPALIDVSFETAKRRLERADLVLGDISYKPDIRHNTVIGITFNGKTITNGTSIPKGSRIDLVIGGKTNEAFDVPNLVGMPQEEAEMLISALKLELGVVNYIYNEPDQEIGTVLRQSPSASGEMVGDSLVNAQIHAGEIIDIWVIGSPAQKPENQQKEEERQEKSETNKSEKPDKAAHFDAHKKRDEEKSNKEKLEIIKRKKEKERKEKAKKQQGNQPKKEEN